MYRSSCALTTRWSGDSCCLTCCKASMKNCSGFSKPGLLVIFVKKVGGRYTISRGPISDRKMWGESEDKAIRLSV